VTNDCKTSVILACFIQRGDVTADGWVIDSVSYEEQNDAIVRVWTHEHFKRPRSTRERHRSWGPVDKIPTA